MRHSLSISCLVLLLAGATGACGRAGVQQGEAIAGARVLPSDTADGLVVTFGTQPDPLQKGSNRLEVTVKTADGAPVTDAKVAALFSMPAMPAMNMPAMRADAPLEHQGDGRYSGTGNLTMGGTWDVAITVAPGSAATSTRRTSVIAKD